MGLPKGRSNHSGHLYEIFACDHDKETILSVWGNRSTDREIEIMIIIRKAEINDANALWRIQTEVFQKYMVKYGDFQRNPAHMTLDRLKFNINYPYGQYYVIEKTVRLSGDICGGD